MLEPFGASFHPNLARHCRRYFDEYYAGFELLLQNYYLKNYSASFSENFYGLKRVSSLTRQNISSPGSRYKSLIFLVIVPYIKSKLDTFLNKIKDDPSRLRENVGWRRTFYAVFMSIYPKLCAGLEFWTLLLQVGYLVRKSDTHSPWLQLAGFILRTTSGEEFANLRTTFLNKENSIDQRLLAKLLGSLRHAWSKIFGWICKMLGTGLLFVQFLDWWQNNERDSKIVVSLPIPKPPHSILLNEKDVLRMAPHQCPICRFKRRNDTALTVSGYVFCYSCIFQHVKIHSSCPVTNLPASTENLVRLFFPDPADSSIH